MLLISVTCVGNTYLGRFWRCFILPFPLSSCFV